MSKKTNDEGAILQQDLLKTRGSVRNLAEIIPYSCGGRVKTLTSNNKGRREISKILMNLSDNRLFCILSTFDDV